jgi:TetR/AcrR family transcriptional regulator, biofilm operon repressor
MERKARIPMQRRAVEKADKIIDAAFILFNEKGYYNTTTADIANKAQVATGSVYAYFEDKKDIYIQVLKRIHEKFANPTRDFWTKNKISLNNADEAKELFNLFLKLMLEYHNFSKMFHDEMEALKRLDEEIKSECSILDVARLQITKDVFGIISIPFKSEKDSQLFLHYSTFLIDDLCHTILYDQTTENIDLYMDRCSHMLYSLLEESVDLSKWTKGHLPT